MYRGYKILWNAHGEMDELNQTRIRALHGTSQLYRKTHGSEERTQSGVIGEQKQTRYVQRLQDTMECTRRDGRAQSDTDPRAPWDISIIQKDSRVGGKNAVGSDRGAETDDLVETLKGLRNGRKLRPPALKQRRYLANARPIHAVRILIKNINKPSATDAFQTRKLIFVITIKQRQQNFPRHASHNPQPRQITFPLGLASVLQRKQLEHRTLIGAAKPGKKKRAVTCNSKSENHAGRAHSPDAAPAPSAQVKRRQIARVDAEDKEVLAEKRR
eukprot:TRINITY_DN332_c0_g2_i1.p2 TRINITY_DN332_c0_g2~~TRINITY_DN332_c0_g2_i1.p2  ORF type:complete len:272 (-),score=-7.23 TRINITY_DN332_c0_g2_i1:523-1338(-)